MNADVLTAILQHLLEHDNNCSDEGCSIAVETSAFTMTLQSCVGFKGTLLDRIITELYSQVNISHNCSLHTTGVLASHRWVEFYNKRLHF